MADLAFKVIIKDNDKQWVQVVDGDLGLRQKIWKSWIFHDPIMA